MPTNTKNLEVEYNTNPKVALDSKKEITMDDFVNKYPCGFYDMDTMINIGDNYIKTGKVLFSEMY